MGDNINATYSCTCSVVASLADIVYRSTSILGILLHLASLLMRTDKTVAGREGSRAARQQPGAGAMNVIGSG